MSVTAARVTASTSAVALNTADTAGMTLALKNTSANAADLGPSTVTAGAGFDLAAGATVTVPLRCGRCVVCDPVGWRRRDDRRPANVEERSIHACH